MSQESSIPFVIASNSARRNSVGTGRTRPAESSSQSHSAEENMEDEKSIQLRKRIVEIQNDSSLNAIEKAKKIQELMISGWSGRVKSSSGLQSTTQNVAVIDHVSEQDKKPTYHDSDAGILGCSHYQRSAKLLSHCCGKWFSCRFCHDEAVMDHTLNRHLTQTMMCMHCSSVQHASQTCTNPACQKRLARYYCPTCKFWDDDPQKSIYHCSDCGICRIGKGLGIDYFHCQKCNMCMAISLQGNDEKGEPKHKCIERNLESDCPICGEYMFTSTNTVIFLPCGHGIHYTCHQQYSQTSYQCPVCFKSVSDMSDYFRRIDAMLSNPLHRMPAEYANMQSLIYCNDCEKKSVAKFHFLYHKCESCQGYNTKVLKTGEEDLEVGVEVATAGSS